MGDELQCGQANCGEPVVLLLADTFGPGGHSRDYKFVHNIDTGKGNDEDHAPVVTRDTVYQVAARHVSELEAKLRRVRKEVTKRFLTRERDLWAKVASKNEPTCVTCGGRANVIIVQGSSQSTLVTHAGASRSDHPVVLSTLAVV